MVDLSSHQGNRVRQCRRECGLTQAELGARAEVSRQTIIAIEQGDYSPSVFLALRLAAALGCSVDHLFYYAQQEEQ